MKTLVITIYHLSVHAVPVSMGTSEDFVAVDDCAAALQPARRGVLTVVAMNRPEVDLHQ
jgi:hypothetical protein